jgi:hypothetical protein
MPEEPYEQPWERPADMSAYVRVRKVEALREYIDHVGTQTDVASLAGLSLQRLNQLYVGVHLTVEVRKAARLEDVVGAKRGELFEAVDGDLLAPYIHVNDQPAETAA